tara:strand:- start:14 stop:346 length:333 start_codon:yes stop_codon:yes gene_type:complete
MVIEAKERIEHFLNEAKTLSFNVKFNNTEPNKNTHELFKSFCKEETSNNYLLGIKKLMDYYKEDWKFKSLYELNEGLRSDLLDLSSKVESEKETKQDNNKSLKTFGEGIE